MRRGLRLLIADDDDGDRKQIRRLLHQAGLGGEIVEASDGAEAVSACERQDFDCAFVDYLMPGRSGLDSLAVLHEHRPHMVIVMVTGEGDEMVASEAIKRGAADYLPKREMTKELIERIVTSALDRASLKHKMDQAREELEVFARVLAHDLSAPLRAINMYAGFVDQSIKKGDLEAIEDDWQGVIKAAGRMEDLISSLHRYTQADATVALDPVSMNSVLDDVMQSLAAVIAERGALVTADPLPDVTGHAVLLTQLFQNLIANGIKYSEAATPKVHVSAERAGDAWRFTVTDNGIGVSEAYREQIFLPFKRLHGVDKFAGTGLGLSTCRRIVERHGGRIWCEAADSGGSVFALTLSPSTS